MGVGLATRGADLATRFRILSSHLGAFVRHFTLKKLVNFLRAEYGLVTKSEVLTSYPYILKIESTNICTLKCAYCYDGRRQPREGERRYGRMTLDQFKGIVDALAPYVFKINLYGFGEPFLFPESLDMVRYATDRNIGVGISSNMNIDDDGLADRIVQSGLEVLIFSCHGVTAESYSKFMVGGNMELAFRNIERLVAARKRARRRLPLIDWQFCLTRFSEGEREAARRKAMELGIDQVRFIKPFLPETAGDEWFAESFESNLSQIQNQTEPDCSWRYRAVYINWDGGISPCCAEVRVLEKDFGNVFHQPFKEIWNNERFRAARRVIRDPQDSSVPKNLVCQTCPMIVNTRRAKLTSSAPSPQAPQKDGA